MKPRTTRALFVLAVFALFTVLAIADDYMNGGGSTSVYRMSPGAWDLYLWHFRYYFAWALVAPGVLWLARKVPFRRDRWLLPLAFHLAVPIVGTLPFWAFRLVLYVALGAGLPSLDALKTMRWGLLFARQACEAIPVYWDVLALGAAVHVLREHGANAMRAIALQRSLAAAQLDALRMKAQPHYLFNTLVGVAGLARAGETAAVVRIVERLGTLLRLSMETSARQLLTLEEELALLDEYLAIEKIRLRDRLSIVCRVAPETRTALVPNLILQPLVESALLDGRAARPDANHLEISARRDGDILRIAMRTDGRMSPRAGIGPSSIGSNLRSVVERLEGLYAGRSRVEVTSDARGRTRVLLSLPFSATETTAA